MPVVASFIASPESGVPPLTVSFFDTSTGGPTNWLWDFGDGTFSDDQNPTHFFDGVPGDGYTVKLTAWLNPTEFPISLSLQTPPGIQRKGGSFVGGNEASWANYLTHSWTNNNPTGNVGLILENWGSDVIVYLGHKYLYSITVPSGPSGAGPSVWMLEAKVNSSGIDLLEGSVTSSLGGEVSASGDVDVWKPLQDLSGFLGTSFDIDFEPVENILTDPGPHDPLIPFTPKKAGIAAGLRAMEYSMGSADDYSISVSSIVLIELPPYIFIDFVGTPLLGTSPLDVNFTDLSNVNTALSVWDFGDGNSVVTAGTTHPTNTYTTYCDLTISGNG